MDAEWVISHDFAFTRAGAERVTAALIEAADARSLLVLAGDPDVSATVANGVDVRIRWPDLSEPDYRLKAALRAPTIARSRPIEGNLLASSYAFAAWLPCTGRKVIYCHSPLRQLWSGSQEYLDQHGFRRRVAFTLAAPAFRALDRAVARRSDALVATSSVVAQRLEMFYGRRPDAILPPPLDDEFYEDRDLPREDHFLFVGRLIEPYKRLSLALEAFAELPYRLRVVGDGPHRARLEAQAPDNVTFVGELRGTDLVSEYRRARGVVFPSTDDFGIVPLEAMGTGTPVIAYSEGGALDTVEEGYSGLFFNELTPSALAAAVRRSTLTSWDSERVRSETRKRFSRESFLSTMRSFL